MIRYRRRENQHILKEIQYYLNERSIMMEWLSEAYSATEQDWLE